MGSIPWAGDLPPSRSDNAFFSGPSPEIDRTRPFPKKRYGKFRAFDSFRTVSLPTSVPSKYRRAGFPNGKPALRFFGRKTTFFEGKFPDWRVAGQLELGTKEPKKLFNPHFANKKAPNRAPNRLYPLEVKSQKGFSHRLRGNGSQTGPFRAVWPIRLLKTGSAFFVPRGYHRHIGSHRSPANGIGGAKNRGGGNAQESGQMAHSGIIPDQSTGGREPFGQFNEVLGTDNLFRVLAQCLFKARLRRPQQEARRESAAPKPTSNRNESLQRPIFPGTSGTGVKNDRAPDSSGSFHGWNRLRAQTEFCQLIPNKFGDMNPPSNGRTGKSPKDAGPMHRSNGPFGRFRSGKKQNGLVFPEKGG
jgi:hypothetical protein